MYCRPSGDRRPRSRNRRYTGIGSPFLKGSMTTKIMVESLAWRRARRNRCLAESRRLRLRLRCDARRANAAVSDDECLTIDVKAKVKNACYGLVRPQFRRAPMCTQAAMISAHRIARLMDRQFFSVRIILHREVRST